MPATDHPAETLKERRPVVFTAHSAQTLYLREKICAFVLGEGKVPINPFMMLGYFLYGLVEKDEIRRANNNLLMRCDELWVFLAEGESAADGIAVEVRLAGELGIPVRCFEMDHYGSRIAEAASQELSGFYR